MVAGEVKELARQTARATDEIVAKVAATQGDAASAATAVTEIADVISRIDALQATVSAAVEEQSATTSEMVRNITEISTGSSEIATNISSIASGTEQNRESAGHTASTAGDVASAAGRLQTLWAASPSEAGGPADPATAARPPPGGPGRRRVSRAAGPTRGGATFARAERSRSSRSCPDGSEATSAASSRSLTLRSWLTALRVLERLLGGAAEVRGHHALRLLDGRAGAHRHLQVLRQGAQPGHLLPRARSAEAGRAHDLEAVGVGLGVDAAGDVAVDGPRRRPPALRSAGAAPGRRAPRLRRPAGPAAASAGRP